MLGFSTTEELDWTQDRDYVAAELAVQIASDTALLAEEEQQRLLRAVLPSDGFLFREPLSLRYQTAKEVASDARRVADEAERTRCAAEQAARTRVLPLWLDQLRDHFSLVAERVEQLAEAFGDLEKFSDRGNVARMQIVDLRIGSGQVNQAGLLHWLTVSRAAVDQQLARKE